MCAVFACTIADTTAFVTKEMHYFHLIGRYAVFSNSAAPYLECAQLNWPEKGVCFEFEAYANEFSKYFEPAVSIVRDAEPELEPPELANFDRSLSQSRRNILCGSGVGAGIV